MSIAGLAKAMRLRIGIGNEDVPLHADRRAIGKFRLGRGRPTAFVQRRLIRIDVGLGGRHRSQRDEMQTLLAGPGRADLIGGAVPERRMRLLQRAQLDRYILVAVVLAFVEKAIRRRPALTHLKASMKMSRERS